MNATTISKLFEPIELNNISLKNRIAMAPMTRSRAINHIPNDMISTYYQQRSSAGLIISEGIAPVPEGIGYSRTPGIYSNEQITEWKKVTQAVHDAGGKIFAQLMHVGRVAHGANRPSGLPILAPSAVAMEGQIWTDAEGMQPYGQPQEMTGVEVEQAIEGFAQAAANAIEAGFDGIELHGANGYLLEQFLNPFTNTRSDEFGGSVVNRMRFVIRVTEAVAQRIGKEKVGIRLSPYNSFNGMKVYDDVYATYEDLAIALGKLNIAYIHVLEIAARMNERGLFLIESMRRNFPNTFIVNGGYTLETATEAIISGKSDLVSFGVPFIANPDLPKRLQHGIPLAEADTATFYSAGAEGFIDYAVSN